MKWKLTHKNDHECIENLGGKTLSYDPNLGIQIIVQDGFAFKDLDNNGKLDPFEDWRLPLTTRVRDFTNRFVLWQENDCLYYKKGKIELSEEYMQWIDSKRFEFTVRNEIDPQLEDMEYLKKNYIISMLLLIFDNDQDTGKDDYLLQVIVQSMNLGVFENIVYSIMRVIKEYVVKYTSTLHLQESQL